MLHRLSRSSHCLALTILSLALVCVPARAQDETQAAAGDAYVRKDPDAATFTVGNARIRLILEIDRAQGLRVRELANAATGRSWTAGLLPDTAVIVGGSALGLGTPSGFRFTRGEASADEAGVELRLVFEHAGRRVRATRHYACSAGSPAVEVFTEFQGLGAATTLGNLNAFKLSVVPGELHWLTGLKAAESQGGSFSRQHRRLAASERLTLGSDGRSSQDTVPWFAVEREGEALFGGLMWSGTWSLAVSGSTSSQEITLGIGLMTTALGPAASVEGPHGFVGVAADAEGGTPAAARDFLERAVRQGRPFQPLITFNTWFAHGAAIDEAIMREEIEHAAALGAELFVLDAGWYPGAGALDAFDYSSGLGRWVADPGRFPSGLRSLRDHAHALGLKFGIWVEPERVALSTVGQRGLAQERWLARRSGRYDPSVPPDQSTSAQVCLAHPDAYAWVLDRLARLVDDVQPDYLKWDNNAWVNCTREGHTHGTTDGNFAHVRALYELLAELRRRYPGLVIENCSGGGNRLDFGFARYADVAWMDDRTSPSSHVRHNLEGLTAVFPGSALLSFVLGEDEAASHDVSLLFRSRMPGVLGIGAGEPGDEAEDWAREVEIYRQVREIQRDAFTRLLTPQAGLPGGSGWEVLLQVSASSSDAVLFAFRGSGGAESILVRPAGLVPSSRYVVRSADSGAIGEATGEELIAQGVEIVASPRSAAHVLTFHAVARGAAEASAGRKK